MSQISDAVDSMSGNELLVFLTTFDYQKPSAEAAAPTRPGDVTSSDYADYYNELENAGTLEYEPDTWGEVEYLHAAGKLDNETYYAALEDLTGASSAPAADASPVQ